MTTMGPYGDGSGVDKVCFPPSTPKTANATGATASIVYNAVNNQAHRITMLEAHYSAAGTGTLTVQDGANTIASFPISGSGLQQINLPPGGIGGTYGNAVTISLTGVAAIVGTINAAKLTA